MVQQTSFLTQSRRNPRFALIALATTAVIVGAFFWESHVGFGTRPPRLIYVQSWPTTRTAQEVVREQTVAETARQAAIAQFEIERGQALASRADTPAARAAATAHIAQNRAALARWTAANITATADLVAHPARSLATPVPANAPVPGGLNGPA